MKQLGINHVTSTPYHPESQGVVERFHQTMKSILHKLCGGQDNLWDEKLPFALFAIRSAPSETLGLTPFEMIFGHKVRGPLEVLRDVWGEDSDNIDVVGRLDELRSNLFKAWEIAKENEIKTKETTKRIFDRKTKVRHFDVGNLVLAL